MIMITCGCGRNNTPSSELSVVVTDTSAMELFCACSPDTKKRYEALRASMEKALGRSVRFEYMTDFLFDALPDDEAQRLRGARLIIGKCTAVEYAAAKLGVGVKPVGLLTRANGSPNLSGVWVAKVENGPRDLFGLTGARISIGRPWHAEKHGDALTQLASNGIEVGAVTERLFCKEAIRDLVAGEADAVVISDYAAAMLSDAEVTRGVSLHVIDRTPPRPYIGVFATDHLTHRDVASISRVLSHEVNQDAKVLDALKSKRGFLPAAGATGVTKQTKGRSTMSGCWFGSGMPCFLPMLIMMALCMIAFCLFGRRCCGWFRERDHSRTDDKTPADILKQRYAKGEITKQEFDRMMQDIR